MHNVFLLRERCPWKGGGGEIYQLMLQPISATPGSSPDTKDSVDSDRRNSMVKTTMLRGSFNMFCNLVFQ